MGQAPSQAVYNKELIAPYQQLHPGLTITGRVQRQQQCPRHENAGA